MKNPKECVCIQQKQTFFVLNELERPEYKDGSEPLLFHHEIFSRFKFVIINAEKKAATGNIAVKELPGIFRRIRNLDLKNQLSVERGKSEATKSAAYTVVITAGKLKGKTPAAALSENETINKPLLVNQRKWLTENLSRYPKNADQIKAIDEALELLETGKLNQEDATTASGMELIFKSGMRPLIRRKRADGKCFVYEIEIQWNGALEKPVEIVIHNYYAAVEKKETGLLNVTAKDSTSEIRNTFSLTMDQWCWVEHQLETNMRTFEDTCAVKNYEKAWEEEKKNIEEAKKEGRIAG